MKKSLLLLTSFCFLLSLQLSAQEAKPRAVINHIAVYVVDLANSTHFYRDIIGLDTISEPFHDGKHTWFSIGSNAHLHLIQGAKAVTEHEKNSHLCFSVPSVPEFIKVLDENNIAYESWKGEKQTVTDRVDGVKQIYITDPDGYWIEVNDAKD